MLETLFVALMQAAAGDPAIEAAVVAPVECAVASNDRQNAFWTCRVDGVEHACREDMHFDDGFGIYCPTDWPPNWRIRRPADADQIVRQHSPVLCAYETEDPTPDNDTRPVRCLRGHDELRCELSNNEHFVGFDCPDQRAERNRVDRTQDAFHRMIEDMAARH